MSKAKKFKELVNKESQPEVDKEVNRTEWIDDIAELFGTISGWLKEEDIRWTRYSTQFSDSSIGQYQSSMMVIVNDGYEATIRPEYTAPRGQRSGVVIRSGKKSGAQTKRLVRIQSDDRTKWKVGMTPTGSLGKNLTKDRFFDLLISIFKLE